MLSCVTLVYVFLPSQMLFLLAVCCISLTTARYAAVPVEDIVDMSELGRLRTPREVETLGAFRGLRDASSNEGVSSSERRGEYVDFGAHTGSRGAYGWHVDFPVSVRY